ncbi:hypothetical protein ILUMI_22898 [Ignelater luminosus]|uniref:Uncharacterized protein n=1 Tax=Ignelater luminosus TaxID=2038154 RepID=A0A8K0C967_IGNLU|nr:hypothetical protein ILUMI_22898 [Ignelater luminosus]
MVNGHTVVGLTQTLFSGIYIILNLSYLIAAPIKKDQMDETPEKWINPLGLDDSNAIFLNSESVPTGKALITRILDQTRIALNQANETKEEFAHRVFNVDSSQLHEDWKSADYEWLPQRRDIHKGLDEPVAEEHLTSLNFDETLVSTYHFLQSIAVGLEQMVKDQGEDGPFLGKFSLSEYNLVLVLQEIQTAIIERGVNDKMKPDIRRGSMPESLRVENNATTKNVRDWIIYRDYISLLQYVWEVFRYLKRKVYSSFDMSLSGKSDSEAPVNEAPTKATPNDVNE